MHREEYLASAVKRALRYLYYDIPFPYDVVVRKEGKEQADQTQEILNWYEKELDEDV